MNIKITMNIMNKITRLSEETHGKSPPGGMSWPDLSCWKLRSLLWGIALEFTTEHEKKNVGGKFFATSAEAKAESGSQGSTENDPKLTKTYGLNGKIMGNSLVNDGKCRF